MLPDRALRQTSFDSAPRPSCPISGAAGSVAHKTGLGVLAGVEFALLCTAACSAENCHGLKGGDTLRITVIDQRPGSGAQKTCHSTIGFPPGQEIHATIIRFGGIHGCLSGIAELEPAGDWSWELFRDPDNGGNILEGLYRARSGDCEGDLSLKVYGEGIPSKAPEPGLMYLQYIPSPLDGGPDGCPQMCVVDLTVAVNKV